MTPEAINEACQWLLLMLLLVWCCGNTSRITEYEADGH